MAGNQYLHVGDEVPLVLQIADGAVDQYPQARVFDGTHHLLGTIDLVHLGNGLYFTGPSIYCMPDDPWIKAQYIVYTDAGHTVESDIYERDIDVFYKQDVNDYKATGFSTHSAADVVTSLEAPGSKLSKIFDTEIIRSAAVSTVISQYLEFNTDLAEGSNNYWTRGALRWTSGNNEGAIRKIQIYSGSTGYIKLRTELVNIIQPGDTFDIIPLRAFRINVEDVDQIVDDSLDELLSAHINVGSVGEGLNRLDDIETDTDDLQTNQGNWATATGFAQPDEYSAVLTVIQNEVDGLNGEAMRGSDGVPTNPLLTNDARLNNLDTAVSTRSSHGDPTSGIKGAPGKTLQEVFNNEKGTNGAYTGTPPTVGEIDAQLTASHGIDSWQEGGGSTPAEIDTELTANHGAGSWQAEGMSEAELHSGLTSYAQKDDYKADLSGLSPKNEYALILADILTEVAGLDGNSIPSTADVTAAIFDKIVEGTLTFSDFQRIMFAMLSGTSSGHGIAGPKTYKSEDGLTDRVAFTCDADGNRLSRVITPG